MFIFNILDKDILNLNIIKFKNKTYCLIFIFYKNNIKRSNNNIICKQNNLKIDF
jgi:hypothetical protein